MEAYRIAMQKHAREMEAYLINQAIAYCDTYIRQTITLKKYAARFDSHHIFNKIKIWNNKVVDNVNPLYVFKMVEIDYQKRGFKTGFKYNPTFDDWSLVIMWWPKRSG